MRVLFLTKTLTHLNRGQQLVQVDLVLSRFLFGQHPQQLRRGPML